MLSKQWIFPQFTILIAEKSFLSNEMLFAPLDYIVEVVVGLDALYPLEDFLILFDDFIHVIDADCMVERCNDFESTVTGIICLARVLEVPLPLRG
jgi:hypothetical protein